MDATLTRFVNAVSDVDDLENLTRPMLELLESLTGLESTYLTTIDETAGLQRILYSRNSSDMQIPEGLEVPWGDTLCKRAMEEGRPYTDNVSTCWGDSEAARALGIRTYVSQPVRQLDGTVYGTLCAAGADSVPLQPGTLDILARFAGMIAQQVDREMALRRMRAENEALSRQALCDPLTGLANRRGMELALTRLRAQCKRNQHGMTIAVVDLDGFKQINDTHGHEIGDQFLMHMARKLVAVVRAGDIVARTGGDEFVVVAEGGPAEQLRTRLSDASAGPFHAGDVRLDYPGASVGAIETPAEETGFEAALKRADAAMYEVKKARKSATGGGAPR